jgi:hypothetical protein
MTICFGIGGRSRPSRSDAGDDRAAVDAEEELRTVANIRPSTTAWIAGGIVHAANQDPGARAPA